MSLRRPKMQIKPKVSMRSMPSMATIVDKQMIESNECSVKECPNVDKLAALPERKTSLTTEVTPVFDEKREDNEDIDGSVDNICDNELICENRDHLTDNGLKEAVVNEECNERTGDKESKVLDMDSNVQKVETKPKSVSKSTTNEVKKRRKVCRKGEKSDKKVMKMKDLLLYNPPMTEEQKGMRDKDVEQTDKQLRSDCLDSTSNKEENNDNSNEDNIDTNCGPRVKVGADGNLILDEESVIVNRKKRSMSGEEPVIETAGTTSAITNYSSFRSKRKTSKPRWNEFETIRFYSALNTIGTDFTLMSKLFFRGKRSRLDLRNKFKKEEKVNKVMIDSALFSPNTFINQCPELEDLLNESSTDSDDDIEDKIVSIKPKAKKNKT